MATKKDFVIKNGLVVTEDIEDMVDPNSTAGSSIEAEDEEESLISSANTVTKEEAVMIKNVDTTSKKKIYITSLKISRDWR